jgi:hypothetical protein
VSRHNKDRRATRVSLPTVKSARHEFYDWMRNIVQGTTRSCGECTACCTVLGIKELSKPPHAPCVHLKSGCDGSGCGIYPNHPPECSDYSCLWHAGWGNYADRPDQSGFIVHIDRHPACHRHE